MDTYQKPNTKDQKQGFGGLGAAREGNKKSKNLGGMNGGLGEMSGGKRPKYKTILCAKYVTLTLFITLMLTLVMTPAARGTTWYFRDSSQSLPPNPPANNYDIPDEPGFAASPANWISRPMTLTTGAIQETANTGTISLSGAYRSLRFVSDPISSDIIMPASTYTVHLHDYTSYYNSANFKPTPCVHIYEWIPATGTLGDVFVPYTWDDVPCSWTSWGSSDIITGNGSNVTLNANNYLCVDVFWYVNEGAGKSGTLYSGWGDATYDSKLTTPGTEVPTLGFILLLIAIALFIVFAIKKGTLRLKPAAMGLLVLLALVLALDIPSSKQISHPVQKHDFYVAVKDESGKEIVRFPMKPVENLHEVQFSR